MDPKKKMLAKVSSIIKETTGAEVDVTVETLLDSLGMDSLDQVEALMAMEEDVNIAIPDGVFEESKTVGDIVEKLAYKSDCCGYLVNYGPPPTCQQCEGECTLVPTVD